MRRLALAACVMLASCGGDTSRDQTPNSGAADVRTEDPDTGGPSADMPPGDGSDASNDMASDMAAVGDECETDIDCTDGVFCNGVERCFRGLCFSSPTAQCGDNSSCTTDQCDEENQRCEYTPDDSLCAPGQVCDSKAGCFTPAACALDADCDDTLLCNGTERCVAGTCEPGDPVQCGDGVACTTDTCVEGTGECQSVADHSRCLATELCVPGTGCSPRPPCMRDDDCDDGLYCNGTETCGADAVCVPGTPPLAPDTVACTIDQCNEALDTVVNIPDNARCSDAIYCNGAEVCHPTNGCGPGVPPPLSDGVSCTVDTCNEALRLVEHAPDNAACDDGAFCNGDEQCHPIDGCSPGEPPMLNDGIGCTVDTCSEVLDMVLHVTDDALCDDGLFCTGLEVCSRTDDCITASTPQIDDGVACTVDTCDESLDAVVNTPTNSRCGTGDLCTSSEVCDAVAGCIAGPPVLIDDNIACTIDTCDPMTGVSNTPDDGECDDGLFCNGQETCGAAGCVSGTSPAIDPNPCTIDSCHEPTDTVTHLPASNGTVCGSAPRSICLAGTCGQSICSDGFVDAGRGETCDDGNTMSNDGCSSTCQTEVSSCDPDDTWAVTSATYSCTIPSILGPPDYALDVNISSVVFSANAATAVVSPGRRFSGESPGIFPVTFTGTGGMCPAGSFSLQRNYLADTTLGGCDEIYTLSGTFTGPDSFSGTLTLQYVQVPGAFMWGTCGTCGGSAAGGTITRNITGSR